MDEEGDRVWTDFVFFLWRVESGLCFSKYALLAAATFFNTNALRYWHGGFGGCGKAQGQGMGRDFACISHFLYPCLQIMAP